MEKIKTYVLTLSKFFPSTHIRKGEPTSFRDAFNAGQVFNRGSSREGGSLCQTMDGKTIQKPARRNSHTDK